jgi:hypothetical protein
VRSVITVDLPEGRVASVAKNACDLRSCQIMKDQDSKNSMSEN